MRKILIAVLFALPFLLFWSCGGGGGSSGPQTIPFNTAPVSGTARQVLAVTAPASILTTGQSYELTWYDEARVAADVSQGSAVSVNTLGVVVPQTLAAATYSVEFAIGTAGDKGVFQVSVTAAPVIADPVAYVTTAQAEIATALSQWGAEIALEPDPAVRATMEQDRQRAQQYFDQIATGLPQATNEQVQLLAEVLAANWHPSAARVGADGQIDPEQVLHEMEVQALEAAGHFALGVVWITWGVAAAIAGATSGAGALPGAGVALIGLMEYRQGYRLMSNLVKKPITIRDSLRILTGLDAGEIQVASGGSVALATTADFGTLSSSARSIPHPSIQSIFTSLDRIYAAVATATQAVLERISSLPPQLPAQPQVQNFAVNPSNLSLVSHTNPQVTLSLANGLLSAATSTNTEQVTTATIQYAVPALGQLTTTVLVLVRPVVIPVGASGSRVGS